MLNSIPESRPPRILEVLEPTIQKVCQFVRPSQPQPQYTVKAMLERSHMYEDMVEKAAQLETLRKLEDEHRQKLCSTLSRFSYNAEQASYRLSTRQWESMTGMLSIEYETVVKASSAHDEMLNSIKAAEHELADMQRTLDDSALWEQEAQ